jgi:pyrimidine-nucleoside phosphorylase
VLNAWDTGYIAAMDTTTIGWAVQRTGAGREPADDSEAPRESLGWEPVDPHAGIIFHARRGGRIEKGQPLATLYATTREQLAESVDLLERAIRFSPKPPPGVPLIQRIFTRKNAEAYLEDAVKVKATASSS